MLLVDKLTVMFLDRSAPSNGVVVWLNFINMLRSIRRRKFYYILHIFAAKAIENAKYKQK